LNEEIFHSLAEARAVIERWRIDYNTKRPHSAHKGIAPAAVHIRPAGDRLCDPDQLRRSPAPPRTAHRLHSAPDSHNE
jgi:putative transposase